MRYIRNITILSVSSIFLFFAIMIFSASPTKRGAVKDYPLFSFIDGLSKCSVKGIKKSMDRISVFKNKYRIKNPNYYPYYSGNIQNINWNIGFLVSKEKKQVETRSSLLITKNIKVCSPQIRIEDNTVFKFATSCASLDNLQAKILYRFRVLSEDGKALLEKTFVQNSGTKKWVNRSIDLSTLSGEDVHIELSSKSSSVMTYPFWANPVVYTKRRSLKPNVIFILVDAVRSDMIGAYGSRLGVSPNIDKLAENGAVFINCIANANWTRPSELSMMTAVYPKDLKINLLDFPVSKQERLHFYKTAKFETMPRLFRKNGYKSSAIVNNIFLQDYSQTGVDLGFDEITDYRTINRDTIDITEKAISWIKEHKDKPYYLFVNYNTPHKPYSAPERFFRQIKKDPGWMYERKVKEYIAEIAYADHYVGKLIDSLRSDKLLKNTIVVITADHGEVLWPFHNFSTVYSKYTRFGHSLTMHDEELKVPFIVYYPKRIRPVKIEKQIRLLDAFPTLIELCSPTNIQRFKKQNKGAGLLNLMDGKKEKIKRPAYIQGFMLEGLRTQNYKYIYRPPGFDKIGLMGRPVNKRVREELYDLKNDPQERNNIINKRPSASIMMRKLFMKYRDSRTKNYLIFNSKKGAAEYTGRITTSGVFYRVKQPAGGRVIASPDGKVLSFYFKANTKKDKNNIKRRKIEFQVHPNYSGIDFSIYKNNRKLSPRDFFLGRFGIPFLKNETSIHKKMEFEVSQSHVVPLPVRKNIDGVYFYREPDELGMRYSRDSSTLSKEIKTVLRDWGYIQTK